MAENFPKSVESSRHPGPENIKKHQRPTLRHYNQIVESKELKTVREKQLVMYN